MRRKLLLAALILVAIVALGLWIIETMRLAGYTP